MLYLIQIGCIWLSYDFHLPDRGLLKQGKCTGLMGQSSNAHVSDMDLTIPTLILNTSASALPRLLLRIHVKVDCSFLIKHVLLPFCESKQKQTRSLLLCAPAFFQVL
jgi:hypothetical protein